MTAASHLARGRWAEDQAAGYLQQQGLRLECRNFRCRAGEIDLIMADGPTLVFVEVRFRSSSRFGTPLDTVTRAKQRKLLVAAGVYLARNRQGHRRCRFDVLSVTKRNYCPAFHWVQDAFGQDA